MGPVAPVFVLGGHLSVEVALAAVQGLSKDTPVAIEEGRGRGERRIHLLSAGMLATGLPELSPGLPLHVALSLEGRTPARVYDVSATTSDLPLASGAVVVDGPVIVGWLPPDSFGSEGLRSAGTGSRLPSIGVDAGVGDGAVVGGGGWAPAGSEPGPSGPMVGAPAQPGPPTKPWWKPSWPTPGSDRPRSATPPSSRPSSPGPDVQAEAESGAEVGADPAEEAGSGSRAPAAARFRAYPHLAAPEATVPERPFTIDVGFLAAATKPGDNAGPVIIANAPAVLTFEVQLSGFGFTFPAGSTASLTVTRDQPVETVPVQAVADAVPAEFLRSIEAIYSLDGVPVGSAWCDVLVRPADAPPSEAALTQPFPAAGAFGSTPTTATTTTAMSTTGTPTSGGSELGPVGAAPPDLTVTIKSRQGYPELEWLFQSPHPVARPTAPVHTTLAQGTAQAFATQLIQQMPRRRDDPLLAAEVRGLGDIVAEQIPVEFWHVLAAVLAAVPGGRTPTVLLVLDEPYIPWELALVDGRIPPDLTPDVAEVPLLGCLFAVGRWLLPRRQPLGPDRPSTPPPDRMGAATMAVVVGDYESSALRLEGAIAECAALIEQFDALRVGITVSDIDALIADRLERDGTPYGPALVHFALHGQTSSAQQQFVGLKIGPRGEQLLHPFSVTASPLTGNNRPFVFLNACQVGAAMTTLGTMGGLVPAFVTSGSRAVVGPLWDVDDGLAKDLSADFYTEVLEQAVPVGEAVRRLRAKFARTEVHTATPLAYVFYGHPGLVLDRSRVDARPDDTDLYDTDVGDADGVGTDPGDGADS